MADDINAMTVVQLRGALKKKGLSTVGLKQQLVQRLESSLASDAEISSPDLSSSQSRAKSKSDLKYAAALSVTCALSASLVDKNLSAKSFLRVRQAVELTHTWETTRLLCSLRLLLKREVMLR